MAKAAIEAAWLRQLLQELQYQNSDSTKVLLYGDNQGALAIAENPESHQHTKHMAVKYNYIREQHQKNLIDLWYIPTTDMVADGLTKSLERVKHEKFIQQLNLQLVKLQD